MKKKTDQDVEAREFYQLFKGSALGKKVYAAMKRDARMGSTPFASTDSQTNFNCGKQEMILKIERRFEKHENNGK